MNTILTQKTSFTIIKKAINDKAHYTRMFYNEILPKIEKISNQPYYGYHGLTHTAQVALFGTELALATGTSPVPVLLASGLHDCARTHDDDCMLHGPRCEKIARDFLATNYPTLSYRAREQIVYAVVNHSRNIPAPDMVSACLWDADRIRLAWELGYNPQFFCTEYGREIASLAPPMQAQYKLRQDKFLIQHNIKTRRQIEYDTMMDQLHCATETKFRSRVK